MEEGAMCETANLQDEMILKLQNALILQCIDQIKLRNDVNDFSERSDFYENLYNQTKNECYNLEIDYEKLYKENQILREEYQKLNAEKEQLINSYYINNINNYGSVALIKIVFRRLITKIIGGKNESN